MLEEELHFLLLRAFNYSNRRVKQVAAELGLCPGQPKILEYLREHDGCFARHICRDCVLDKSTMTSLLARMEKQGLIQKEGSEADRRAVHICLTEKGKEMAQKLKEGCFEIDEMALHGISQEEREVFLRTLSQIADNLRKGSL